MLGKRANSMFRMRVYGQKGDENISLKILLSARQKGERDEEIFGDVYLLLFPVGFTCS